MSNLTSKELSAIEDSLKCEQTLISKCNMYACQTQDTELKTKLGEIAQKHQNHYDKLYSLLG
jgi:hypothetical protein